jgi:hypothetical protein
VAKTVDELFSLAPETPPAERQVQQRRNERWPARYEPFLTNYSVTIISAREERIVLNADPERATGYYFMPAIGN